MIYICSDIHGQYELYSKIIADLTDDDILYILGDVIDRGPESIKIIQDIMSRKNVILLIGNHEFMMLAHLFGYHNYDWWLSSSNGGAETLKQFEKLSRKEQLAIKKFLTRDTYLQIQVTCENGKTFMLSHSASLPDKGTIKGALCLEDTSAPITLEDLFAVTWCSPFRHDLFTSVNAYSTNKCHIIGHVPVQYVYLLSNDTDVIQTIPYDVSFESGPHIIDIDGGCSYLGKRKSVDHMDCGLILFNLTTYSITNSVKESSKLYTYEGVRTY